MPLLTAHPDQQPQHDSFRRHTDNHEAFAVAAFAEPTLFLAIR